MKNTLTAIALVLGLATQAHAMDYHQQMIDLQDQIDELREDVDQARIDAEDAQEEAWFEQQQNQLLHGYAAPAPVAPTPQVSGPAYWNWANKHCAGSC